MQGWSLERKIQVAQTRIIDWYQAWNGAVYISFSGGKDSTVLLDLVRRIYPNVPAVFCDTGLEYPEIRDFVKTKDNVEWIKPIQWNSKQRTYTPINFRQVIMEYGYPLISKEQAKFIREFRTTKSDKLKTLRIEGNLKGRGKISKIWMPLAYSDIPVSEKCCNVMKKTPAKVYEKMTGRHPYIGTMAEESKLRESNWIRYGCNAFDKDRPTSQPLSFWTNQDVLSYLRQFKIPYASIYGEIREREVLYTTGVDRTGCIFCGFGCHLDKHPNRFEKLKITHPQLYEYCMKSIEDGGLGMDSVLSFIGVNH